MYVRHQNNSTSNINSINRVDCNIYKINKNKTKANLNQVCILPGKCTANATQERRAVFRVHHQIQNATHCDIK